MSRNVARWLRIFRAARTLQRHEKVSRDALVDLQAEGPEKAAGLRVPAFSFLPRIPRNMENRPTDELPILTKGMLMERLDDPVTDRSIRIQEIRDSIRQNPTTKRCPGKSLIKVLK